MSQENVELGHRVVDAFNRRDLDAVLALADDDIEGAPALASIEGHYHGHAGVRRWWESLFSGLPDFTVEVVEVTLAAAAIAALFVVPVFGGTTTILKRQVNATEARHLGSTIGGTFRTVVALPLKPGNYLLSANYESGRQPREFVNCMLAAGGKLADAGGSSGPDLPPSPNPSRFVIEHPTLSGVVHLDTRARATLKCRTNTGHQTGFLNSKIIALRLPKVTLVGH